jgi:nuclear pore complex protein Nup50
VFTKRVKLYYYNEEEKKFCDRGIGNLFIKPINNGESTSLVVRADTTLANILLNVKLSKALPIAKAGPKDVSYLCVPNPPIPKTKSNAPCKFLFKVKTEDDANELLEKLNEYKK